MPSYRLIPAPQAVAEFGLDSGPYEVFDARNWMWDNYIRDSLVLVHDGDLHLPGPLSLDWDQDKDDFARFATDIAEAHGLDWPDDKRLSSFVVNGALRVDGAVLNANSNDGAHLVVLGALHATSVVGGGAYLVMRGPATVTDAVYGHYNDGSLVFSSSLSAPLLLNHDHDLRLDGKHSVQVLFSSHDVDGWIVDGESVDFEDEDEDEDEDDALPPAVLDRLHPDIGDAVDLVEFLLAGKPVMHPEA